MASTMVKISCHCHCRNFNISLTLPASAFPLKSALCHCNSCRHATGQLFATFAVIPLPSPPAEFEQKCVGYASSETLKRYFCPVCGSNVGNVEVGEWEFATGMLELDTQQQGFLDGKLNRAMLWISDTKDGGAVPWLNDGKAEGWKRWMKGRETSLEVSDDMIHAMVNLSREEEEEKQGQNDEELSCHCHCGDIKFTVARPDGRERYRASLDACTSCRKTCGFEITNWFFVPRDKVRMPNGGQLDRESAGLGRYSSSEGVNRYFCKKCGATIVYAQEGRDTIDIAAGLVDSSLGARADNWLEWNADGDDVAHEVDAVDKQFVRKLAQGIRKATGPNSSRLAD